MASLLISIVVTIVLAVLFHAWLRRSETRWLEGLDRWADSAGWRPRSAPARTTLPASWPEFPPKVWGSPRPSFDGERDGYPLVVEWISSDEWSATVCYATLRESHRTATLHRRPFARRLPPHEQYVESGSLPSHARDVLSTTSADSWQVYGRHLAAIRREFLGPNRIDALIDEVVAVGAAIDCPPLPPVDEPSTGE